MASSSHFVSVASRVSEAGTVVVGAINRPRTSKARKKSRISESLQPCFRRIASSERTCKISDSVAGETNSEHEPAKKAFSTRLLALRGCELIAPRTTMFASTTARIIAWRGRAAQQRSRSVQAHAPKCLDYGASLFGRPSIRRPRSFSFRIAKARLWAQGGRWSARQRQALSGAESFPERG